MAVKSFFVQLGFSVSKSLQFGVMFVSKAGAYLSGPSFSDFFLEQSTRLARRHLTRLEKLARDKRSSLLRRFVNYVLKFFMTLAPGGLGSLLV